MTRLHILGSGTPTPTPERWGTGFILKIGNDRLMVDCGPASTYKMQQMGIAPPAVDHLFFTHYHSDHVADYPCFLMTHFEQTMDPSVLSIYGPPPLQPITEKIWGSENSAFRDNIIARTEHPMSIEVYRARGGVGRRSHPRLAIQEVAPQDTIRQRDWSCTVHEVTHAQPYLNCFGYRFQTAQGIVAFGGDGHADEALAKVAQDADLFVMAAMGFERSERRRAGAILARDANVRRLVITHQSPALTASSAAVTEVIGDIKREFQGPVYWGKDMITIDW